MAVPLERSDVVNEDLEEALAQALEDVDRIKRSRVDLYKMFTFESSSELFSARINCGTIVLQI